MVVSLGAGAYTEWQSRVVSARRAAAPGRPAGAPRRQAPLLPELHRSPPALCDRPSGHLPCASCLTHSHCAKRPQAYYWYKKTKAACEEEQGAACPMGGYTRLLHRCLGGTARLLRLALLLHAMPSSRSPRRPCSAPACLPARPNAHDAAASRIHGWARSPRRWWTRCRQS